MPEALYPKLDCGTLNLESFELEINHSFAIYLRFILLNSILFKSFFFFPIHEFSKKQCFKPNLTTSIDQSLRMIPEILQKS